MEGTAPPHVQLAAARELAGTADQTATEIDAWVGILKVWLERDMSETGYSSPIFIDEFVRHAGPVLSAAVLERCVEVLPARLMLELISYFPADPALRRQVALHVIEDPTQGLDTVWHAVTVLNSEDADLKSYIAALRSVVDRPVASGGGSGTEAAAMLARLGLTPDDRDRAITRLVELTGHDMYRASALVVLYNIGYSNVLELLDEHGNPDSMWDLATLVELLVEMQETGRAVSVAEQIGRQGMGTGGSPDEQNSATSYVMERVGRAFRRADNLSDYIVALRTWVGDEAEEWLRLIAGRALLHTEFNADALDAFGSLVRPTSRPVSTLAKDATGEDSEVARDAWEEIAALLRINTDASAAAKEARRILMGYFLAATGATDADSDEDIPF